jgi:hypothetical protein
MFHNLNVTGDCQFCIDISSVNLVKLKADQSAIKREFARFMEVSSKTSMKNILIVLTCLLIVAGCKKSVDELPEVTQSGANTFGLKLNGEFWVPQKFAGINAPILKAQLTGSNVNDLLITAQNFASEPLESQFNLYIKNITGPGTFQLNQNTDIYPSAAVNYAYYVRRKINPLNEWITTAQYTGTVTITKWDLTNNIVSGTFEFRAGSMDNSTEPITVTDGRFDIRLQ